MKDRGTAVEKVPVGARRIFISVAADAQRL